MAFITACSGDESVGSGGNEQEPVETPLTFSCQDEQTVTRALSDYLYNYVSDFKVYGAKYKSSYECVFPNYTVWYSNVLGQTNTNAWEYVGTTKQSQSVKYWDMDASKYTFWAVANASKLENGFVVDNSADTIGKVQPSASFVETIANVKDDTKCLYITNPTYVEKADFGKPVVLRFYRFRSKIRVGFYEAISENEASHRYDIKNFRYYPVLADGTFGNLDDNTGNNVYLSSIFAQKETVTVSYDKVKANFSSEVIDTLKYRDMGTLSYTGESLPATVVYAMSDDSDSDGYVTVMPCDKTGAITILCSYTVEDTTGEETTRYMNRVTAVVPAAYTEWLPNHSYTYIFKVTEMGTITLADVQITDWQQGDDVTTPEWHNW